MTIRIRAAGYLRQDIPDNTIVDKATTVGEALQQLELSLDGELILMVNDKPAHWRTMLHDGDTLRILPGIAGG